MKTYWDTSAVMNAAVSAEGYAALDAGEHVTRTHTFAEFFNRMTGRGIRCLDADGNAREVVFAAVKAGADQVFTRETDGFARLGAVVAWPQSGRI